MVRVSKAQHFADATSGGSSSPCANGDPLITGNCGLTVTATCPSGALVVSGGYSMDQSYAFATSSYPAGTSAWTVTVHDEGQDPGSPHPVTVTAFADCLQANGTATTQIVASAPSVPADGNVHTQSVSCPTGTVLTGGGFRGSNGAPVTRPVSTSWQVEVSVQLGSTAKPKLFAVCATSHLAAAAMPSTLKSLPWYESGTVTVACASGQLLVGGGSSVTGPGNMQTNATTTDGSHWQVLVNGPTVAPSGVTIKVTVYAVCVTVV